MTNYLDQTHPALSPDLLTVAVDELIGRAISLSYIVRFQFDYEGLEQAIGPAALAELLANLSKLPAVGPGDLYEGLLDAPKATLLRRLLAFSPSGWSDLPLNYIEVVRLMDARGHTILRGNDTNDVLLFAFPAPEHHDLIAAYKSHGIPEAVVEAIQVDLEGLSP
jgi:hypothetical protein